MQNLFSQRYMGSSYSYLYPMMQTHTHTYMHTHTHTHIHTHTYMHTHTHTHNNTHTNNPHGINFNLRNQEPQLVHACFKNTLRFNLREYNFSKFLVACSQTSLVVGFNTLWKYISQLQYIPPHQYWWQIWLCPPFHKSRSGLAISLPLKILFTQINWL